MLVSCLFLSNFFCLVCFCVLLKFSLSNETIGHELAGNNSQEQLQPTPLILHLNKSAADFLIQEANSMYVSNTSFADLVNDNDTHQLFMRYRERKRQARLMSIQQEILLKLGLEQEPNVTSRISEEERMNLVSTFDRLSEMSERNDSVIEA